MATAVRIDGAHNPAPPASEKPVRVVRIAGTTMSATELIGRIMAVGFPWYYKNDLEWYIHSSKDFGNYPAFHRVELACPFFNNTKTGGCTNAHCKYIHDPTGLMWPALYPSSDPRRKPTKAEIDQNNSIALNKFYKGFKRALMAVRFGETLSAETCEEIADNHTPGFIMNATSVDAVLLGHANTQNEKRQLIAAANITSEDEIAELMQLCMHDLRKRLTPDIIPAAANAASDDITNTFRSPVGEKGREYALKASSGIKNPPKVHRKTFASVAGAPKTITASTAETASTNPLLTALADTPEASAAGGGGTFAPEVSLAMRIVAIEKTLAAQARTIQKLEQRLGWSTNAPVGAEKGTNESTPPVLPAPVGAATNAPVGAEVGTNEKTSPLLVGASKKVTGNWADEAGEA